MKLELARTTVATSNANPLDLPQFPGQSHLARSYQLPQMHLDNAQYIKTGLRVQDVLGEWNNRGRRLHKSGKKNALSRDKAWGRS